MPFEFYNDIVPLLSFFVGILLEKVNKFVYFNTNQSDRSFISLLNNLYQQLSVVKIVLKLLKFYQIIWSFERVLNDWLFDKFLELRFNEGCLFLLVQIFDFCLNELQRVCLFTSSSDLRISSIWLSI